MPNDVPMPIAPGTKKTIAVLLGVMIFMAAVATAFVFSTKDERRRNDFELPIRGKRRVPADAVSTPPSEMTVVGLLPARCGVIGAVNLGDVRKNPVAAKVFQQKARSLEWLRDALQDSTGLKLDDVDQAAAGIVADGDLKIYVVLQTNKPFDGDAVLKSFAGKKGMLRKRPYVEFPLDFAGRGIAWSLTHRHLVFLFRLDEGPLSDLEAMVPDRPRRKLEGSSATVQSLVGERVESQSLAWLAADLPDVRPIVAFLSAVGARVEPYRQLLNAKAVTLSLRADQDVVALLRVLPRSEKDATATAQWLQATDWRGASTKLVLTPPEEKTDPWVTLQLRCSPEAMGKLLSQGPGVKRD